MGLSEFEYGRIAQALITILSRYDKDCLRAEVGDLAIQFLGKESYLNVPDCLQQYSVEQTDMVFEIIRNNSEAIPAIKEIRRSLGCGLKEAKDIWDACRDSG